MKTLHFGYDHEASSGQRWTFPIGFGVNKTSIYNGTPVKFGIDFWYYAAQPDAFGPSCRVRFAVSPLVPLPW